MIEHLLPGWIQRIPVSQEALLSHVHHLPCRCVHGDGALIAQRCLLRLLLGLLEKATRQITHQHDSPSLIIRLNLSLRIVPGMMNPRHITQGYARMLAKNAQIKAKKKKKKADSSEEGIAVLE